MAEKKNQVAKAAATDMANSDRYRLKKVYAENAVPALKKAFAYENVNQIPRLEKIVLKKGCGDVKSKSLQRQRKALQTSNSEKV